MRDAAAGKPAPGSDAAVAAGCRCPRVDNGYGRGSGRVGADREPLFWVNDECPVHGRAEHREA